MTASCGAAIPVLCGCGSALEQPAGAGQARAVVLIVEHAQLDRPAGLRRVNEAPFAGVDRDVRDALALDPEEQQIARLEAARCSTGVAAENCSAAVRGTAMPSWS